MNTKAKFQVFIVKTLILYWGNKLTSYVNLNLFLGDQPFADVYKIQGLRGIYVASQIINIADPTTITRIEPANLKSLISFDQGGMWIPIKGSFKNQFTVKTI